jgi:type IV fimbrial biogenesis protein FimT
VPKPLQQGFSLIELLVAISIAAILVAMATPSIEGIINSNRLRAAANETAATLQAARMEAIRANRMTVACMSANPDAVVPACNAAAPLGWIVFQDADRNGEYGATERLIRRANVSGNVKLLGSAAFAGKVTFNADGMARDAGGSLLNAAVSVCLPTAQPAENTTHISIRSGSRIRMDKANAAGQCLAPGDKP